MARVASKKKNVESMGLAVDFDRMSCSRWIVAGEERDFWGKNARTFDEASMLKIDFSCS